VSAFLEKENPPAARSLAKVLGPAAPRWKDLEQQVAAREAELPEAILELIDKAPRYAEGRAVRIEVRSDRDVRSVLKVAEIKMGNV
jgi:hypothetical protein